MPKITGKQLVEEYVKTIGRFTYAQRDCIWSVWEILRKYGAKTDLVGSNWFARHELRNMRPLTNKSQLYDGCAVLKTVLPGQTGYNLPDRYESDRDPIDYNHIGVGTSDGRILDSTRTASGRDGPGWSTAKIGPSSWDIIADFEDVNYERTPNTMKQMYVTARSGSTVRMRQKPSPSAIALRHVPVGAQVSVLDVEGPWSNIDYQGQIGWMMSEFLTTGAPAPVQPVDRLALLAEQETLLARLQGITKALREAS